MQLLPRDTEKGIHEMKVLMIACSGQGYLLMKRLEKVWHQKEADIQFICRIKCSQEVGCEIQKEERIPEKQSLKECVGQWFEKVDAIIFICAAGIAVRCIAPYIRHKSTDPAVVAVDEAGTFSISLLSGHRGRANETAEKIGDFLTAVPVITTATDCAGKFAVDVFADKNDLFLTDWEMAKKLSAHILAGHKLGICSDLPVEGTIPEELIWYDMKVREKEEGEAIKAGISITYRKLKEPPFLENLQLIPKSLVIGIGCRKNISEEETALAIESCLMEHELLLQAVGEIASIDLKKEEKGILSFCRSRQLPFMTYSPETLEEVKGSAAQSQFVRQVTGVDNVCERSALASGGRLIAGRRIYGGVTTAVAVKKGSVRF